MTDRSSLLPSTIDTAPMVNGRISVTANFLKAEQVNALRADAKALYCSGAFVPGGLRLPRRHHHHLNNSSSDKNSNSNNNNKKGGTTTSADVQTTRDERTRLCDVCGLFDDAEKAEETVGDRDAREDLFDLMSELREMLQKELGVDLLESMELQYLRYPGGDSSNGSGSNANNKQGFYGRHFDHTGDDDKKYRRRVSLLLYLNEDGWNAETDGGMLRAYIRPKGKSGGGDTSIIVQDVVPEGGKLVLFDSTSVEHEVLPTCKERWAVVGWFLTEKEKPETAGVSGRAGGKKRSRHSGEEQTNSSKKRKKKKRRKGR
jgi:hypothetical protein